MRRWLPELFCSCSGELSMPKRNCELGSACPYQARRYTHESSACNISLYIAPSLHLLFYRRCRESATMKRAIRLIKNNTNNNKY